MVLAKYQNVESQRNAIGTEIQVPCQGLTPISSMASKSVIAPSIEEGE